MDFESSVPKYERWTTPEVQKMLEIWSEDCIQERLNTCKRNNSIFLEMSRKLRVYGFSKTALQIKSKLKLLKQMYYKIKFKNNTSGKKHPYFEFYAQFDAVLGSKDVVNTATLDSMENFEIETEQEEEDCQIIDTQENNISFEIHDPDISSTDTDNRPQTPTLFRKKKKLLSKSKQEDFLNQYFEFEKEMMKNRRSLEEKMIEKFEAIAKASDAADENREIRMQEHEVRVMEMFVSAINNLTQTLLSTKN